MYVRTFDINIIHGYTYLVRLIFGRGFNLEIFS